MGRNGGAWAKYRMLIMNSHWYAIYTKFNEEAKLQDAIVNLSESYDLGYETYLPHTELIKRWKDRVKVKQVLAFKNYLFVRHDDNAFHKIKSMRGFCHYVSFGRGPSSIPCEQIDMLKKVAKHQLIKESGFIKATTGTKVRIVRGPLKGYDAILLRKNARASVVLAINSINLFLNVNMDAKDVEFI